LTWGGTAEPRWRHLGSCHLKWPPANSVPPKNHLGGFGGSPLFWRLFSWPLLGSGAIRPSGPCCTVPCPGQGLLIGAGGPSPLCHPEEGKLGPTGRIYYQADLGIHKDNGLPCLPGTAESFTTFAAMAHQSRVRLPSACLVLSSRPSEPPPAHLLDPRHPRFCRLAPNPLFAFPDLPGSWLIVLGPHPTMTETELDPC